MKPAFYTSKHFWLAAMILVAGKLLWFALYGVLFEFDSLGYLVLQADLLHPPGYNVFCTTLLRLTGQPESIIMMQTMLFSLSVAYAAHHWLSRPGMKIFLAILLAVDPCTGLLCADLMSEILFVSLLLPLFVQVTFLLRSLSPVEGQRSLSPAEGPPRSLSPVEGPRPVPGFAMANRRTGNQMRLLLTAGILLGALWYLRHAAAIVFLAVLAGFLFSKLKWKKKILAPAAILIVAQALLLPLKLYYHQQFGTWQTSAYSGYSLWNSAAHLVPGSDMQRFPRSGFEQYAAAFPDSAYTVQRTLGTAHIFAPDLPLQSYIALHHLSTAEQMDLSAEVQQTALRLIAERPGTHLSRMMLPNFCKPFTTTEWVDTRPLESDIPPKYHLHRRHETVYVPWAWWPWAILLLVTMALMLIRRKSMFPQPVALLLFFFIGGAWLVTHLMGATFLRYFYFLAPFIALLATVVAEKLFWKPGGVS